MTNIYNLSESEVGNLLEVGNLRSPYPLIIMSVIATGLAIAYTGMIMAGCVMIKMVKYCLNHRNAQTKSLQKLPITNQNHKNLKEGGEEGCNILSPPKTFTPQQATFQVVHPASRSNNSTLQTTQKKSRHLTPA